MTPSLDEVLQSPDLLRGIAGCLAGDGRLAAASQLEAMAGDIDARSDPQAMKLAELAYNRISISRTLLEPRPWATLPFRDKRHWIDMVKAVRELVTETGP